MSAASTDRDDELVCRDVVEVVTDYLEGAMAAEERQRFEAHLAECPFCVEYVEQMRTVGGALRGLSPDELPPERRDALLAAFRDLRQR
jgi:anti-sigma factor RsiW